MSGDWIPACAGMTKACAGMTKASAGMTKASTGMIAGTIAAMTAALFLVACASPEGKAPKVAAPKPAYDKALVARGEALAALGNCRTCHTLPDGKSYAGGVPFKTAFGTDRS